MARAFLFVLFCAACGGPPMGSPVEPPQPSPEPPPPAPPARCSALDVHELLARNAREHGSPAAVTAELPLTLNADVDIDGKRGRYTLAIDRAASRSQLDLGAVRAADGLDAGGPWTLGVGSGVVESLRADEADGFELWLLRRQYVDAWSPSRDAVTCEDAPVLLADEHGKITRPPTAKLTFRIPEVGEPTVAFDLATAAIVSSEHASPDGHKSASAFEWGERDTSGVRWPRLVVTRTSSGNRQAARFAAPARGADVARPADRFSLRFPDKAVAPNATGLAAPGVVRVPFEYVGNALLVRVKVGGRDAWAILDSGASMSLVDAGSRVAESFRPSVEVTGAGSTQAARFGLGELAAIDVGDLHAEHVPAASAPIPALAALGSRRPELILGYSFFAAAGVRVDYKRGELVFAKTADGLVAKSAREVPMRVLDEKLVVDGAVEGQTAPFALDTGNSGGLDLYAKWASAHGLPGASKTASVTGRFGVGAAATTSTYLRLRRASLGPIAWDDQLSQISDPPDPGLVAGLAGNEAFARCDAVVFDHAKRRLWLEGACDGPVPEPRAGFRAERSGDAWVVAVLWPGGAADRAGMKLGDRVVEIDGKALTDDVVPLVSLNARADGTKVPVGLERDGKKDRVVLELHAPLR